jgi:hypothetical protein
MSRPVSDGYAMRSFMHLVNLPIHEAGHVLFRPFGDYLTSLGGSLLQLLLPLSLGAYQLLRSRDPLGSAVCLWWHGQNYHDLAPYIADAREMVLPLLGGNTGRTAPYGFHDWNFLLAEKGLLQHDRAIAGAAAAAGSVIMLLSVAWGAAVLLSHRREAG